MPLSASSSSLKYIQVPFKTVLKDYSMKLNEARRYDYSIKDTLLNMPKRPDKKKKLINYRISVERTLRENKNNIIQLQVTETIKSNIMHSKQNKE